MPPRQRPVRRVRQRGHAAREERPGLQFRNQEDIRRFRLTGWIQLGTMLSRMLIFVIVRKSMFRWVGPETDLDRALMVTGTILGIWATMANSERIQVAEFHRRVWIGLNAMIGIMCGVTVIAQIDHLLGTGIVGAIDRLLAGILTLFLPLLY